MTERQKDNIRKSRPLNYSMCTKCHAMHHHLVMLLLLLSAVAFIVWCSLLYHHHHQTEKKNSKNYMCNNKMEMELFWYFETSMWLDTQRSGIFTSCVRIKGSLILFLSPKYRKPSPKRARAHTRICTVVHRPLKKGKY